MKILLFLPFLLGFAIPANVQSKLNIGEVGKAFFERKVIPINWCLFGKAKLTHCYKTDK